MITPEQLPDTFYRVKVKALILCSLSPYFKEDIKNLEKDWVKSWKKDFIHSDYSFVEVAKKIHTKTYLCVGKEEHLACRNNSVVFFCLETSAVSRVREALLREEEPLVTKQIL